MKIGWQNSFYQTYLEYLTYFSFFLSNIVVASCTYCTPTIYVLFFPYVDIVEYTRQTKRYTTWVNLIFINKNSWPALLIGVYYIYNLKFKNICLNKQILVFIWIMVIKCLVRLVYSLYSLLSRQTKFLTTIIHINF